jgi:hypothetical protein
MVLNSVTPAKAGVHDQSVENPAKQEDLNARKNPVQSSQKNCSSVFSGAWLQMFRTVVGESRDPVSFFIPLYIS